jgi:hypothetical protein
MKKQTALQWLYAKLDQMPTRDEVCDLVYQLEEEAKAMEKEQSITDYCQGFQASGDGWKREYGLNDTLYMAEEIEAEKYYNETYGSDK